MWEPFQKVINGVRLDNAEASAIHEVGVDDIQTNTSDKSIDWGDKLPDMVVPSIKNLRLCAEKSSYVNGIIEDLVVKSISGWVVQGENENAIKYIHEV